MTDEKKNNLLDLEKEAQRYFKKHGLNYLKITTDRYEIVIDERDNNKD